MRRVSTVFSAVAVATIMAGLVLLPHGGDSAPVDPALPRANLSIVRIDPTPVGTVKQMARIKRIKAGRKA